MTRVERRRRIGIVGAGVMGITSALYLLRRNVDVVVFEASSRVGGVWVDHANQDSCLQIGGDHYRLDWDTRWRANDHVTRSEILGELARVAGKEGVLRSIRFNTPVRQAIPMNDGSWCVNGTETVDGLLVATGLLQSPHVPTWPGGELLEPVHASRLDGVAMRGKDVVIVGCGAYALEALRKAQGDGARSVTLIARRWRWNAPRRMHGVVGARLDTMALLMPGTEGPGNRVMEATLRALYARHGLSHLIPSTRFYSNQVAFSDTFFDLARDPSVAYLTGDVDHLERGTVVTSDGRRLRADVLVAATGFEAPKYPFLPLEACPDTTPSSLLFLWSMVPGFPTLCFSGLFSGAGTHGNGAGALQAALLLKMIENPQGRPDAREMNRWIAEYQRRFRPEVFQTIPNVFEFTAAYAASAAAHWRLLL